MDRVFAGVEIGRQTESEVAGANKNADSNSLMKFSVRRGRDEETRTPDPLHAKYALSSRRDVHIYHARSSPYVC